MLRCGILLVWILSLTLLKPVFAFEPVNIDEVKFSRHSLNADTIKKSNLLKKLSEAIKFRKNAITKEQQRVQVIIESMISKDSTIATVQDLEKLKDDLSASNKEQFDMLLDLIKEIRVSNSSDLVEDEPQPGINPNIPFKVTKELDPNDKYINDLVDRLIPILTDSKEDDEKTKSRRERLKLMRDIYASNGTSIDTVSDSIAIRYRLKLGHKAEVYGFHPDHSSYTSNPYNFSTLSGLVYDSYELDGNTGFAKKINRWNDSQVISNAQDAGTKVFLNISAQNSLEVARFLTNQTAIATLTGKTLELLEQRDADGVNIDISGLNQRLRPQFVQFIESLSKAYRSKSREYQISITLPVYDDLKAYDIVNLDPLVDRFIIDFSKKPTNYPGPVAPLNDDSDYNIQSSVSRYLNAGIPPYKFILCLSYSGAEFEQDPFTKTEHFKGYVPYKTIRLNYQYAPVTYNEEKAYASIETRDDEGNLTGYIYFDNERSLEKKYDFVLQNGLGGIAFKNLGEDEGYGELWDALAYKFVKIDTVSRETIALKPLSMEVLSVWQYVKKHLVSYYHALQNPCDPAYDHAEPLLLTIFNIVLGLSSVLLTLLLVYQIKRNGEKWRWKKTLMRILIFTFNLFIITMFMWLYIDNRFPWFGSGEDCIDMPFSILLLIIITGILLGSLIMRFLIFPAIQHDERP